MRDSFTRYIKDLKSFYDALNLRSVKTKNFIPIKLSIAETLVANMKAVKRAYSRGRVKLLSHLRLRKLIIMLLANPTI
jgi:hypothetical protein